MRGIVLFLLLLLGPSSLSAETLDDKLVQITVDTPLGFQRQAAVVWKTTGSDESHSKRLSLENGTHVYEMRGVPGWSGELAEIQLVTSSTVEADLELVQPTFQQERDIVFRNQPWLPELVNHMPAVYVGGGYTLHWLSPLLLMLVMLSARYGCKQSWPRSIGVSLLLTLLLIEVRFSVDRWTLARQIAAREETVYLYDEIDQFREEAADELEGKRWTMVEVDRFRKYGLFYQFAESPYVTKLKEADFAVSTKRLPPEPVAEVGKISLYRVKNR